MHAVRAQRPRLAYPMELTQFHAEDYVNFLSRVTPDNAEDLAGQLAQFNMGEDCPVFDGLYDFCRRWGLQRCTFLLWLSVHSAAC